MDTVLAMMIVANTVFATLFLKGGAMNDKSEFKAVDIRALYGAGTARGPRVCTLRGCFKSTREGKPFCPDHVDSNPYVQGILAQLKARDEEEELVRRHGACFVNVGEMRAQGLLEHLHIHGDKTMERVAREVQLDVPTLKKYMTALKKVGLVTFGRTARGATIVRLNRERYPSNGST